MLDRQLISAAIWILGALLGPLALTWALEGDTILLLSMGMAAFLFLIVFVMKERAVVLPVIGLSMGGRLNFLPFGLDVVAVCGLSLIIYYFFACFTMRQRNILTGPYVFFIPICVITAIVLYHCRRLGLYNLMGSSEEGSRQGLMMLLGTMIYFCGISVDSPSRKFLGLLPYYCFVLAMVAQAPDVISTFFPSTAPYLYYFTSNVNVEAYRASAGYASDIVRNPAFASIGANLSLFLLCWYPVYTWWRPYRWWVPVLLVVGFALVLPGGFRNQVVVFCVIVLLALWCYFSWRSLLVLPLFVAGAYALSLSVSNGLLPMSLASQRALSFLPGEWDPTVVASAKGSNDFRNSIQKVYREEEMYKSPWIGNGFSFDRAQYQKLLDLSASGDTPDGYYTAKAFIASKMFHIGWISLYDTLGLIGGAAFSVMMLAMLCIVTYFISGRSDPADELYRLKVWLFCNIGGQAFAYFAVFGDARATFLSMCASSVLLVHLCRLELGWGKKEDALVLREREGIGAVGKVDPAPSLLQS